MTVNDVERLEHFAIMSGLAPQSVDAIRPDFPRWVRYMKEKGVTEVRTRPRLVIPTRSTWRAC
jgi:hypothetical protein